MASETYPWDSFRRNRDLDQTLCFLLSPLDPDFAGPHQVVQEVAKELNLRCERADDIQRPGVIHADIWDNIQRAVIIIADITKSNPNVMLELGVATAVKEQFRVILILRQDAAQGVPFDLGPFRHIRYEDTLAGSSALRNKLREYFRLALSEDATVSSLVARMEEWERSERHYALLVSTETLARTRALAKSGALDERLLAYLLATAIQHGVDVDWWTRLNVDNLGAAEVATELLLGPWVRPQFRAAYVLQQLNDNIRSPALDVARRSSPLPLVSRLLDAVAAKRVIEFTVGESSGMLNESDRYELLQNFTPRIRVRL